MSEHPSLNNTFALDMSLLDEYKKKRQLLLEEKDLAGTSEPGPVVDDRELRGLRAEVASLTTGNRDLSEQIDKQQRELRNQKKEVDDLIKSAQIQRDQFQADLTDLRQELYNIKSESEDLRRSLAAAQQQIQTLKESKEKPDAGQTSVTELQRKTDTLRKEIEKLESTKKAENQKITQQGELLARIKIAQETTRQKKI